MIAIGWALLLVCPVIWWSRTVWAVGTPAGTAIANTAVISYTLDGDNSLHTTTASNSFRVLEVIDTVMTWQDAAAVPVNSPHSGRILTFLLANTGNGPEAFTLHVDSTLTDDQFQPDLQQIWLESNGLEGLQTTGDSPDTPYQSGTAAAELPADGSLQVYLASDIPAGLANGDMGLVRLTAVAATTGAAGAAPGTTLVDAGLDGVDAVVGAGGAASGAVGSYAVHTVSVQITKAIEQIVDPAGGEHPCTGAQVTYRLTIDLVGNGTATGLVVADAIPEGMTYIPGTILIDGIVQTDALDAPTDSSDFNGTADNTVTIHFGDLTAPAVHTIQFSTRIN